MRKTKSFTLVEILVILAVLIITAAGVVVWRATPQPTEPTQPALPPLPALPSLATEIQYEDLNASLTCINPHKLQYEEDFVINSRGEYQNLYNYVLPSDPCKSYTLPEIDFSQKTLLGKYASGGGCSIDFVRKISRDDINKEIIYSIMVVEEGMCKMLGVSMNWALVPKIPSGYAVRFEVQ